MLAGDQFESVSVQRARENMAASGELADDLVTRFRDGVFSWDELLLLSQVVVDGEWRRYAACQGMDPELFFPVRGQSTDYAKRVCADCSVQSDCMRYAADAGEPFGVWGGVGARGRKRGDRLVQRPCAVCGGRMTSSHGRTVCGEECRQVRRRESRRDYDARRESR